MGFYNSLKDEVKFLFSGKGMPYEKVCIMVAMIISVFLSVILAGNFGKDVPVIIIDLDNSRYSHELTTKIDASEYMKVKDIIFSPTNPEELFYRDEVSAVIYFPQDTEKNFYSGSPSNIGIFYDNTNTAQTADIKEAMAELVAIENAMATGGSSSGLTLNARNLFNPAGSTSNTQTQGFLFFFGSMFFVFATIGMIPRLRLTHQYEKIISEGTPWDLIGRLVPYCVGMVVSFFVGLAVLRVWGDLVFSGRVVEFLLIQIVYAVTVGMLSVLFGWTAANPGIASSRMILFIPGGFILGGVTSPLGHFSPWVVTLSHIFPLTWEFHFTRDIIQRGASLTEISSEIGAFFVYVAVVAILLCLRFYKSQKELLGTVKKETLEQLQTPTETTTAWQGVQIKNILVPTDGSGQAFKAVNQAIHIAAVCDAKITLMMCVDLDNEVAAFEQVSVSGYVPSELNAAAYDLLSELMLVVPREIPVKTRVEIGDPAENIVDVATNGGFDLVIMGSRGFGGFFEGMGSVSRYVLENAPCPVIVVKGMPDDWDDEQNYLKK